MSFKRCFFGGLISLRSKIIYAFVLLYIAVFILGLCRVLPPLSGRLITPAALLMYAIISALLEAAFTYDRGNKKRGAHKPGGRAAKPGKGEAAPGGGQAAVSGGGRAAVSSGGQAAEETLYRVVRNAATGELELPFEDIVLGDSVILSKGDYIPFSGDVVGGRAWIIYGGKIYEKHPETGRDKKRNHSHSRNHNHHRYYHVEVGSLVYSGNMIIEVARKKVFDAAHGKRADISRLRTMDVGHRPEAAGRRTTDALRRSDKAERKAAADSVNADVSLGGKAVATTKFARPRVWWVRGGAFVIALLMVIIRCIMGDMIKFGTYEALLDNLALALCVTCIVAPFWHDDTFFTEAFNRFQKRMRIRRGVDLNELGKAHTLAVDSTEIYPPSDPIFSVISAGDGPTAWDFKSLSDITAVPEPIRGMLADNIKVITENRYGQISRDADALALRRFAHLDDGSGSIADGNVADVADGSRATGVSGISGVSKATDVTGVSSETDVTGVTKATDVADVAEMVYNGGLSDKFPAQNRSEALQKSADGKSLAKSYDGLEMLTEIPFTPGSGFEAATYRRNGVTATEYYGRPNFLASGFAHDEAGRRPIEPRVAERLASLFETLESEGKRVRMIAVNRSPIRAGVLPLDGWLILGYFVFPGVPTFAMKKTINAVTDSGIEVKLLPTFETAAYDKYLLKTLRLAGMMPTYTLQSSSDLLDFTTIDLSLESATGGANMTHNVAGNSDDGANKILMGNVNIAGVAKSEIGLTAGSEKAAANLVGGANNNNPAADGVNSVNKAVERKHTAAAVTDPTALAANAVSIAPSCAESGVLTAADIVTETPVAADALADAVNVVMLAKRLRGFVNIFVIITVILVIFSFFLFTFVLSPLPVAFGDDIIPASLALTLLIGILETLCLRFV
jgi:hypothetical protein